MTREEKIKRVIELQKITKDAKAESDALKLELYPELDDKQEMFGYSITKSGRTTYKATDELDIIELAGKYPEYIKMDLAKVYDSLDDVEKYIIKTTSTGLTFKEKKVKVVEEKERDF